MDPNNKLLWSGLKACEEAYEADKKKRFAAAERERQVETNRIEIQNQIKQKRTQAQERKVVEERENTLLSSFFDDMQHSSKNKVSESDRGEEGTTDLFNTVSENQHSSGADVNEDDVLADFFNAVSSSTEAIQQKKAQQIDTKIIEKTETQTTEKYVNQDLGAPKSQFDRLLQPHYEWRNLNPYAVLQLGIDATDEDIKHRYRKLSLKVHPDRLRTVENARDAFEQVK